MTYNAELNNAELTEFARVHNAAIARHEQWLTEQQETLAQINASLQETAQSQARTQEQQEINTQEIANLRASILDLRNLVADYLQGRSQP